jgi:hypothetical protein
LFDVTYGLYFELPDGFAEAREISRSFRPAAHELYAPALAAYYGDRQPPIDIARGGDFFETVAFTNYLIDGVERVE